MFRKSSAGLKRYKGIRHRRQLHVESLESRQVLSAVGWSTAIGDVADDRANDVGTDGLGNAYVGGYVNGQDGDTNSQLFLAKYDSAGAEQWNRTATNYDDGSSIITQLAVDSVGNSYAAGRFSGQVEFGPGVSRTADTTDGSDYDGFLAKFDTSGNVQWVHQLNVAPWDNSDIAIREDDTTGTHIYLTGENWNTQALTYDQSVIVPNSLGHTAAYLIDVVDAGSNGVVTNAIQVQEAGRIRPNGLAVSATGEIYLVGEFQGGDKPSDSYPTTSIGDELLTSVGWYDPFVAKFSSELDAAWALPLGGSEYTESGDAVAVDGQGNVYVTGNYWHSVEIGGVTLESSPKRTAYIAKLTETESGPAVSWVKNIGANEGGTAFPYSLGVDETKGPGETSLYLSGVFQGVLDFDPDSTQEHLVATTTPTETTLYDTGQQAFLLQMSDQGEFANVWQFGQTAHDMSVSSDGSVYVAGWYEADSLAMVTRNLDPAGGQDGFLISVDPEAPVVAVTSGGVFTEGEATTINASATDRVDGDLSASVDWALDDVPYAFGSATVDLSGLIVGRHTLLATVTDSDGVTGSYTLTFDVNPAAPNLIAAAIDGTSVTLWWTDPSTGETGFVIERAPRPKGKAAPVWEQVGSAGANTTSFTDSDVLSGSYIYRVRAIHELAVDKILCSAWSDELEVSLSDGGAGGGGKGGGKPNK